MIQGRGSFQSVGGDEAFEKLGELVDEALGGISISGKTKQALNSLMEEVGRGKRSCKSFAVDLCLTATISFFFPNNVPQVVGTQEEFQSEVVDRIITEEEEVEIRIRLLSELNPSKGAGRNLSRSKSYPPGVGGVDPLVLATGSLPVALNDNEGGISSTAALLSSDAGLMQSEDSPMMRSYDSLSAVRKIIEESTPGYVSPYVSPHLAGLRAAKWAVVNLKSLLLTTILGAFINPSFANLVLIAVAGVPLFISAAAIEVIEFGLTVAEAVEDGSIKTLKGAAHVAFEGLKTAAIVTAVTGSVAKASVFKAAVLGLAGGLTPLLFTGALAAASAVSFVGAAYNYYRSTKVAELVRHPFCKFH